MYPLYPIISLIAVLLWLYVVSTRECTTKNKIGIYEPMPSWMDESFTIRTNTYIDTPTEDNYMQFYNI